MVRQERLILSKQREQTPFRLQRLLYFGDYRIILGRSCILSKAIRISLGSLRGDTGRWCLFLETTRVSLGNLQVSLESLLRLETHLVVLYEDWDTFEFL